MSKININNYDYIMFVDASGDDGYKFKEKSCDGSSFTFVVSCFVIEPKDFDHNVSILNNIKKIINLDLNKELKSTSLKRHRFAEQAYLKIRELKGSAFSLVAFKKAIISSSSNTYTLLKNVSDKDLSVLSHSFPYYVLAKLKVFKATDKILIIMDNMKKIEKDNIRSGIESYGNLDIVSSNYDLHFKDSQDKEFPLIQIADIISGSVRDYFESELDMTAFRHMCSHCSFKHNLCKVSHNKKFFKNIRISERFKIILNLHKHDITTTLMLQHIVTLPITYSRYYFYLDCFYNKKLQNKRS